MTNSERLAVGFSRPIIMTLYQSKLVGHQMAYPRLHSFKHYANTEATRRFFPYSVPTLKTHRWLTTLSHVRLLGRDNVIVGRDKDAEPETYIDHTDR